MKLSKDEKVENFLQDLKLIDANKFDIIIEIRTIVFQIYPKASEKIMYGGIIFFLAKEMFSGIFAYKNHVTIEFGQGFLMKDPDQRLLGKGKYRRHLKLVDIQDIADQQITYFVKQAIQEE